MTTSRQGREGEQSNPRSPASAGARTFEVYVDLAGRSVLAGRALFRLRGATLVTEFGYADSYLADERAYELCPALPLQRSPHVVRGLPGPFADTSPDWWGRNLITRRLRAQAAASGSAPPLVTELDFLVGVSDRTRQGALRFLEPTSEVFVAPTDDVPRLVDLPQLLAASEQVAASRDHPPRGPQADNGDTSATATAGLKLLLQAGSATLGGARPKASVLDGRRLAIAKFPDAGDDWDVMAWEKTALDLAEAAGIVVPVRRLERIDGRTVLILDRFDRTDAGERIGYISALTLLDEQSSAGHDYVDLAEAIGDSSADADADLFDLWTRMVFSVAIHNTDDHMRNHGFLRTGKGWRLSPAFDMNPNPALGEVRSSSIFGAVDARSEVAALRASAAIFGVSEHGADVVIARVGEAVSHWNDIAESNGVDAGERRRFAPTLNLMLERLGAATGA